MLRIPEAEAMMVSLPKGASKHPLWRASPSVATGFGRGLRERSACGSRLADLTIGVNGDEDLRECDDERAVRETAEKGAGSWH